MVEAQLVIIVQKGACVSSRVASLCVLCQDINVFFTKKTQISFNAVPKRPPTTHHHSFLVYADIFLVAVFRTDERLTPGCSILASRTKMQTCVTSTQLLGDASVTSRQSAMFWMQFQRKKCRNKRKRPQIASPISQRIRHFLQMHQTNNITHVITRNTRSVPTKQKHLVLS